MGLPPHVLHDVRHGPRVTSDTPRGLYSRRRGLDVETMLGRDCARLNARLLSRARGPSAPATGAGRGYSSLGPSQNSDSVSAGGAWGWGRRVGAVPRRRRPVVPGSPTTRDASHVVRGTDATMPTLPMSALRISVTTVSLFATVPNDCRDCTNRMSKGKAAPAYARASVLTLTRRGRVRSASPNGRSNCAGALDSRTGAPRRPPPA
jgi:hypothetical protein